MDAKTKIVKMLRYSVKVMLAVMLVFGTLFILAFLAELGKASFSLLNVIRNMLPGALGIGAAIVLASHFVATLYALDNWVDGATHIIRGIFGQPTMKPIMIVSEGKVNALASDKVLVRVGGQGGILIYNDSAVVLEQGGRLTRVLGPGSFDKLACFERVHDVIDLRPMRWDYEVEALSREGIPVTVSVDVTFQINTGGQASSDSIPYPALDQAVFTASTCRWMRSPEGGEDDQYFDWARRVIISNTEGDLRGIIARYPLDVLVGLENSSASNKAIPRRTIQDELKKKLQKSCSSLGAQINEVWLGRIKVHDKVAEQWLDAWKNEWRYWSMIQGKAGEAKREQLREAAKAQAQVDMITAVAQAFQQSASQDARIPPRLLAMRLLEVFDRSSVGPYTYLPEQAIKTLESLRDMVK
jgi:regulator of protease activity HflC (stomatin/prohibitin superfamily)